MLTNSPKQANKRKHSRFPVNTKANFWNMGEPFPDAENVSGGEAIDACEEGIFIKTNQVHPMGSKLRILLGLPSSGNVLVLQADVRWSGDTMKGPGMGMQLEGVMLKPELLASLSGTSNSDS